MTDSEQTDTGIEADSLDKVRDILFGKQAEAADRRMVRIEKQLQEQLAAVRKDMQARFESLDQFLRKELQLLSSRIDEGQEAQGSSSTELAARVDDQGQALQAELTALDARSSESLSQLEGRVQAGAQLIREELDAALARMRAAKVDRSALSSMLGELARGLDERSDNEG